MSFLQCAPRPEKAHLSSRHVEREQARVMFDIHCNGTCLCETGFRVAILYTGPPGRERLSCAPKSLRIFLGTFSVFVCVQRHTERCDQVW